MRHQTDTIDRELTIVPYPQRSAWAVVNRRGDIIATGGYAHCLRELGYRVPSAVAESVAAPG